MAARELGDKRQSSGKHNKRRHSAVDVIWQDQPGKSYQQSEQGQSGRCKRDGGRSTNLVTRVYRIAPQPRLR